MNLGTVVTIAEAAPENLVHFVFENGTNEANGAHPIPGAGVVDFSAIAKAAGIPNVHAFSEQDALAEALPDILTAPGPTFVDLKVVPGGRYEYRWDVVHGPQSRAVFPRGDASRARRPLTPLRGHDSGQVGRRAGRTEVHATQTGGRRP